MRNDRYSNDVSWYTKYPQLAIPAGTAQYINVPGMKLPIFNVAGVNNPIVPGVMALNWVPSFGDTIDPLNGVNLAGQEIYTRVRASFGGSIDADAPDFLMYLGALDSIYAYIGWLKRLYRSISTYSPDNFEMPRVLLHAQLQTSTSQSDAAIVELRKHKQEFYSMINELIYAVDKFKCPAVMDIMNRHYWMSDNVFTDAASPKAQLYIYNLVGVYQLTMLPIVGDTAGNTAAGLSMKEIPHPTSSPSTYHELLYTFGMGLINALDAWDDGYTISGYLRGAFSGTPNFTVALLESGEQIEATYSTEVLSQIENFRPLDIFGMGLSGGVGVTNIMIQQDVVHNKVVASNVLHYTVSGAGPLANYPAYLQSFAGTKGLLTNQNVYLNSRLDNPGVGDTIVASRMCAVATSYNYNKVDSTITVDVNFDCGTEVPTMALIFNLNVNDQVEDYEVLPYLQLGAGSNFASSGNIPEQAIVAWALAEQFDWHPISVLIWQSGITPAAGGYSVSMMGDIHNCAVVTPTQLHDMHRVCIFSELNAFSIM